MRTITIIFLALAGIYFTSCSKGNTIPTVTGTINGAPAITLYGTTNEPVDYILFSSNSNLKELSYGGAVYTYYNSASNGIYVTITPGSRVVGTIDTVDSKTVITFTPPYNPFASGTYTSR